MARVEVPVTVITTTGTPVSGAAVAITVRSSGAPATWYTAESGGTGSTSSVITDSNGRITAWVERGAYNLTISGAGITTYTEPFDAAPASDGTIDIPWLGPGIIQTGFVALDAGTTPPTGWLVCDGSAVSRTTYAALFARLSTGFGAGDGSTTFNLPDLRGRVPVGAGSGPGLTARTRGQTGGAETHVLTTAQLPAHSHATVAGNNMTAQSGWPVSGGTGFPWVSSGAGTPDTGLTGGGAAHNIMQPFGVLNYIIKT